MSPIHIKCNLLASSFCNRIDHIADLENMGVRASMSIVSVLNLDQRFLFC